MEEKLSFIVELLLKDPSETFSIVVSIITVCISLYTVFILRRGLNQWKNQINHKHKHDILVWAHKFLNMMEELTGSRSFEGEGMEILELDCSEKYGKCDDALRSACRYASRIKSYGDLIREYEDVKITAKLFNTDLFENLEKLHKEWWSLNSTAKELLNGSNSQKIDAIEYLINKKFNETVEDHARKLKEHARKLRDGDDIIIPKIKGIIEKMEKL